MAARRYAVIGTGAVGGYYGACLQRGGIDVHFLLRRDYDAVKARGLIVESVQGDFRLPQVNAYRHPHEMPPVDVVLVALKTTHNALLPDLLAPLIKPETVILTLQNGFEIEKEIAAWAPDQPILGATCSICSNKVGPGQIRHLDYGSIRLGQYSPDQQPAGITPLVEAIGADFRQAQIEVHLTPDLRLARWQKLVWNIPFNGLSVILNATTDEMMAHPSSRQLAEALMEEVVAASVADLDRLTPDQTRRLPPHIVAKTLAQTAVMKPYRTSMKIDYEEGRPMELEAIFGNSLRAGQTAGLSLPRIEMLYLQLKALNQGQESYPH